ncbi:hypothetical protein BKA69DRAFT_201661 [Paraphysoderma sedebokerense]|nr:hypothetical protein BKA69DRAFT_201661 [Paraphysoderma sedebokerense]
MNFGLVVVAVICFLSDILIEAAPATVVQHGIIRVAPILKFQVPNSGAEWQCGETGQIKVTTEDIIAGSFLGTANSKLTLMDANHHRAIMIMSKPIFDSIKIEKSFLGLPGRIGSGEVSFTVPKVTSGQYTIQFEASAAVFEQCRLVLWFSESIVKNR